MPHSVRVGASVRSPRCRFPINDPTAHDSAAVSLRGSCKKLKDQASPAVWLGEFLERRGWSRTPSHDAAGPDGTVYARRSQGCSSPTFGWTAPTTHFEFELRSQVRHEDRQRDFEPSCEPRQRVQARIPFASLNAADVGHVQVGAFRESFLRQPQSFAQLPHTVPQGGP